VCCAAVTVIIILHGTAVLINARRQWRARPTDGFLRARALEGPIGIRGVRVYTQRPRDAAVESDSVAVGPRDNGTNNNINTVSLLSSYYYVR
jgi:hypothetical protein